MNVSRDEIRFAYNSIDVGILLLSPYFQDTGEAPRETSRTELGNKIRSRAPPTRYPPEEKLKNPSWGPSELETRISSLSGMIFGKIIQKKLI